MTEHESIPSIAASSEETGSLSARPHDKQQVEQRVRTIVGHIKGIQKMVEEERYCVDILKQIASIRSQLSQLATVVSEAHMKHCVRGAVEEGAGDEKIEELMEVLKYLRQT